MKSTPSPLRGTPTCLRGRVSYGNTALANCPTETGGRARSAEGVDSFSSFTYTLKNSLIARRSSFISLHIQLCAPKVVAIAVRMVMRMLRIFPQVELLLKVPMV